jgi:adenylate cyclase
LATAGNLMTFISGDLDAAKEMVDRAVALNSNSAFVLNQRGYLYLGSGQAEEAIRSFERAIRLSPLDPMNFMSFAGLASAFIRLGRFDEAVAAAKKSLRQSQTYTGAYRCLAAASAHLGREAEAREAVVRILELEPNFRISEWLPGGGRWQSPQFIEGFRNAGLPE